MSFFRTCLITLLCSFCYATSQAQYTIDGTITDNTKSAVPYATVLLFSLPDTTLLETALADTAGSFNLKAATTKNTLLSISSTGYDDFYRLLSKDGSETINAVLKTSAHMLQGVTVSSRKPLIQRKADRVVFNVENSVSANGSDAFDLLRKAPGVRVNNNNVGIVGKGSVSVMINERLVQLSGDELESLLRTMPSESIARIEVITTPPAKYDAEGNAGIINIVTRHNLNTGLNGTLSGSYTQRIRPSWAANAMLNYRANRLNVYGNIFTRKNIFSSDQQNITYYATQRQDQWLTQVHTFAFGAGELGADYNLTPHAILGVNVKYAERNRRIDQDYNIGVTGVPSERIDSTMLTNALQRVKGNKVAANVNYEWKIDSAGRKLNIDLDYFNNDDYTTRDFVTQNSFPDGLPTGYNSDNKTYAHQFYAIYAAKADLVWPCKLADLGMGIKASSITNEAANRFDYLDRNIYITDPLRTDDFSYTENTQAIYLSAKKEWKKWEAQAGLRGEYTQTKSTSRTLAQTNTDDYFRIFPTLYIVYKPDENNAINLSYSRRIERPEFWQFNPFKQYTTPISYNVGNPFLQPYYTTNLELSYTLNSGYTVTLFLSHNKDFFSQISLIDTPANSYYFTSVNAGSDLDYGISASIALRPFDWWESNNELSGFYSQVTSPFYGGTSFTKPGGDFSTENEFILNRNKTLILELGYRYQTSQQEDVEIQDGYSVFWGGFKAMLMDKQLTLGLNFNDPFHTGYYRVRNQYNNTYQNHYYDQQNISFSAALKFGNKNVKARRERAQAEELQRVGN